MIINNYHYSKYQISNAEIIFIKEKSLNKSYIAHVNLSSENVTHSLIDHLTKVASIACNFGLSIGSDWCDLAGRWHDLGKFRAKWQEYIRDKSGYERENAHIESSWRIPHSTAGAIHATKTLDSFSGHIIAYLISGHHAGLPDWNHGKKRDLFFRLQSSLEEYEETLLENIPPELLKAKPPENPYYLVDDVQNVLSLWMRLLFSCLVDADYLDTESYMDKSRSDIRSKSSSLADLQTRLNSGMDKFSDKKPPSPINQIRKKVRNECLSAAKQEPGIFSLTVPTGGGKTLASLSFALSHALEFKKSRVIYGIPFTSIIEQNAAVFREFLGDENVLEHHSNLDTDPSIETSHSRLAAENWDAPLIVTTNVQLFESLFAARPSRCRKLHNIVNSVIILDEAQQIPREFQRPITDMMMYLAKYFGVTWVLCTATQPDLTSNTSPFGMLLFEGLENVREIMSNPSKLMKDLSRVSIQFPKPDQEKVSWQSLAQELALEDCVLVIVNTRKDANLLFKALSDDGHSLHLSGTMCAEHRSKTIQEIKSRLQERSQGSNRPLRVVSTSLVEAGVDVDFPVVYRAMSGLDSIAQAAGRCNREGKISTGKVIVFLSPTPPPIGSIRQGAAATQELLSCGELDDPLSPTTIKKYFNLYNKNSGNRDSKNIRSLLATNPNSEGIPGISFRTAAERFQLIDESGTTSIVTPYKTDEQDETPVETWLKLLEKDPSQKWIYRKLQRYTVTIPNSLLKKLEMHGCVEKCSGLSVLLGSDYSKIFGVEFPQDLLEAENCII